MMKRKAASAIVAAAAIALIGSALLAQSAAPRRPFEISPEATRAMLARGKALELPTPYAPPPGDPISHAAAGYATTTCAAAFVTGLPDAVAIDKLGFPTASAEERARLGRPVIDHARREVRVPVPGGPERVARFYGSQGCIALPIGAKGIFYKPVKVVPKLPAAATTAWPMGDKLGPRPSEGIDLARVDAAVAAAFADPAAETSAFVVTWKGQIVGERYAPGIGPTTPLESWSMGKSILAALMGVLIERGTYALDQPAPIAEWHKVPGDPRAKIRIRDLLNMSSGLRARSSSDPDFDPAAGYADHQYLYTGTDDAVHYAATRPLQWPPGMVGRYRNSDPVLIGALVRQAAEKAGQNHLLFPQRALFDRIGIRSAVLETDPYGNFLLQGYELLAARDWARLANLFLQDGLWQGRRILPADYVRFVQTPAPGWTADGRPLYGGFFVLNRDGPYPVPADAYFMAGAGGQTVLIIPSLDMTVVRIGHSSGQRAGGRTFNEALRLLAGAVRR